MSAPISVQVCELCKSEFRMPMGVTRRGGYYYEPSCRFMAEYSSSASDKLDIDLDVVCPECSGKILVAARQCIRSIRREAKVLR